MGPVRSPGGNRIQWAPAEHNDLQVVTAPHHLKLRQSTTADFQRRREPIERDFMTYLMTTPWTLEGRYNAIQKAVGAIYDQYFAPRWLQSTFLSGKRCLNTPEA
jgi:hypothetical protein